MQVDDTDIRTFVRSHLARHRVDMTKVQLRVFNGTVRMTGEIKHLGQEKPMTLSTLESLEREIIVTSGARHAFFEFDNFRRLVTGEWEPVQEVKVAKESGGQRLKAAIPMEELLGVRPVRRKAA